MTNTLLASAFTTPEIEAAVNERAWLQGMLDFESALAWALAEADVMPRAAAEAIAGACDADRFDVQALGAATAAGGNPAIPLVKQLTAQVPESVAGYVHWGATSQDVIDTATMGVVRNALAIIQDELEIVAAQCADLAEQYRSTVMVGRTLLQQALPITFGLKAAGWHAQIDRVRSELDRVRRKAPTVQLGGAVGTLASLEGSGERILRSVAHRLELNEPELPWHTARDRVIRIQSTLGLVAGSMGKIAGDIALMMQTEVGEYSEAAAGGSSTMPHKRNPVASTLALAAAQRVTGMMSGAFASLLQQHERAAGPWHAEWDTLFDMLRLTAAAVRHVRNATDGPTVNTERMRDNLEHTHGVIMAEAAAMRLAPALGKAQAHEILAQACARAMETQRPLAEILKADERVSAHLTPEQIDTALTPEHYLGTTDRFIDRALNRVD